MATQNGRDLGGTVIEAALVSVIMPAQNCTRYIHHAITSVFAQTYQDWELIVVDDGSTDNTTGLVSQFQEHDKRIVLLRLPAPRGRARARNLAIKSARGRYIAFLDCDDEWLPGKLERQLGVMRQTGAVLSFTAYKKIDSDGKVGDATIGVPRSVTYTELLKTNVIACLTAVYDTHCLGKMYMPENQGNSEIHKWSHFFRFETLHEDYALWLAILRRIRSDFHMSGSGTVVGINEVLAHYRIHDHSVSRNKLRAAAMQWAVYRRVERLPLWRSLYYLVHYAYNGIKKARSH